MGKLRFYFMFSLISGMSIFFTGCKASLLSDFTLRETVEAELLEKLTIEEHNLFVDTIFTGDISVQGSLKWLESQIKLVHEDSYIVSTVFFILFEYPLHEFPSGYKRGVILSNVEYVLSSHHIAGVDVKTSKHLGWFCVGRIRRKSNKVKRVQVRLTVWLSQTAVVSTSDKLYEIREEFKRENGEWKLMTFKDTMFAELRSSLTP